MSRVINLQGGGRAEGLSALIRVNAETGSTVSCNGVQGTEKQVLNPEWRNLPSGYTQVEWIQSDGANTQITTDITNSADLKVTTNFQIHSVTGSTGLFGYAWNNNNFLLTYSSADTDFIWFGGANRFSVRTLDTDHYIEATHSSLLLNGTTYSYTDTYSGSGYMTLFKVGAYGNSQTKLKDFKAYRGSALAYDYVPCKNSSNEYGLYDMVNNVFKGNSGSGSFTGGEEVPQYIGGQWDFPVSASLVPNPSYRNLPSGYKQVEYLQSSGSQYIDTNYIPKNTSGFNVKIITTSYNTYNSFGSSGSNNFWGFGYVGSNHDYYVYWLNAGGAGYLASAWSLDEEHLVSVNYKNSRTNYLDGVQVGTISSTISPSLTAYLFATNVNNSPVEPINAKLISVEFTEDANTVRDLVPCLNESTNKYGLYDMVSQTFFGNSGTGDFTGGEEVPQYIAPTYTVTATKGSKSASQLVQVDYVGLYEVTLEYKLWLYNAGDEFDETTGGLGISGYTISGSRTIQQATKNANNISVVAGSGKLVIVGTINPINVTPYSKLYIAVTSVSGTSTWLLSTTKTDFTSSGNFVKLGRIQSTGNLEYSITDVSSTSLYFSVGDLDDGSSCVITKMWLE